MRGSVLLFLGVVSGCAVDFDVITPEPELVEPETPVVEEPEVPVVSEEPGVEEVPEVPQEPVVEEPPMWEDPVPQARARVYANTRDTLFEVDPVSGAVDEIGAFHNGAASIDGVVDIAIDPIGRLFAGDRGDSSSGPFRIWRVDPTTAEASVICSVQVKLDALAFTSAGVLVAGDGPNLVTIDVDHGCGTSILYSGDWVTSGDVVGLPDGLLYWTVRGDDGDGLVVVDPRTQLSGFRGDVSFDRLFGLGYDEAEGALYGFSADGEIVHIGSGDGHGELLSEHDLGWWGATTNPVAW